MPYKSDAQRGFMHVHHPGIASRWDKEIHEAKRRKRKKGTVAKNTRYGNSGGVGRRITVSQLEEVDKGLAKVIRRGMYDARSPGKGSAVRRARVDKKLETRLANILNRSTRSGSLGSGIPNRGVASATPGIGRHRSARTDATPAYMARLRRNARQGTIGAGEYVGRRRKVTKGMLHQSVARPIARRAATATLASRGITQGRLVARGGAGARKGNLGVAKGQVGKARYFDPDERRQRRSGMAVGALGILGAAGVARGAKGAAKSTKVIRRAGKIVERWNDPGLSSAVNRGVTVGRRDLAYLGGGAAGLASAAEVQRRGTSRRGGRWT